MTYTPEQLRDSAAYTEALIVQRGLLHVTVDATGHMNQLRAHAAALEDVERLKAERDRAFDKLAIDAVQYDALLAERDRERKEHAQWVRDHQADTDAAHRAKQRVESALAEAERKGREQGMREAAEIANQHGSVEGIAQKIENAILSAIGEK